MAGKVEDCLQAVVAAVADDQVGCRQRRSSTDMPRGGPGRVRSLSALARRKRAELSLADRPTNHCWECRKAELANHCAVDLVYDLCGHPLGGNHASSDRQLLGQFHLAPRALRSSCRIGVHRRRRTIARRTARGIGERPRSHQDDRHGRRACRSADEGCRCRVPLHQPRVFRGGLLRRIPRPRPHPADHGPARGNRDLAGGRLLPDLGQAGFRQYPCDRRDRPGRRADV